ncbi:MAG: DegV family protein [Natronospirillum sp.]|uniref:DegV family protein n=1 Tax=Natronospirillum sp. TaxID=2812955 RepID=UPI0026014DCA|nr:DegV family protein [Natronospirillum sp.]MCH8551519.1 DegV family protein [Natronospirillum sp.]
MRVTLAIDAAADLPRQVIDDYGIHVLTVQVTADGHDIEDTRQPERTLEAYRDHLIDKFVYVGHQRRRRRFTLAPPDTEALEEALWAKALPGTDYLMVLCGSHTLSHHFHTLKPIIQRLQDRLSLADSQTRIRLLDTQTLFAGQGLVAAQALAFIKRGKEHSELRRNINHTAELTHTFMVPTDLTYLNERQAAFDHPPLRWTSGSLGFPPKETPIICSFRNKMFTVDRQPTFDQAVTAVFNQTVRILQRGAESPYVSLSYAGDLLDLERFTGVQDLRKLHQERKIVLLISTMGLAGATCLGPGSVSLAVASIDHEWSTAA